MSAWDKKGLSSATFGAQNDDELCEACTEGRHAACDNGFSFCDCCGGAA